jgi:hypothetical protein
MKKTVALICSVAIAAQWSVVSAQTTKMKIWKGGDVTKIFRTADIDSVTFITDDYCAEEDIHIIDGHKFVDLGLPSGLLWATTNIGAATAADEGDYYAWGETEPKQYFDWDTYEHCNSASSLTKYNASDGLTTLEKDDDAASVLWGSSCRMPTVAEMGELLDPRNCTWAWVRRITSSGLPIEGHRVTSKQNGNSIFIPASGCYYYGDAYYSSSFGLYWSSTLYTDDSDGTIYAYYLNFDSTVHYQDYFARCFGRTIRPVAMP